MGLNNSVIMGRITNDLEIKQTQSGIAVLSFTVAVNRTYGKQGDEKQADFIDCVAWRNTAEFIGKYFSKGKMIALQGELRTRIYEDKNGSKHKVTELYINNAEFTGEKAAAPQSVDAAAIELGGFDEIGSDSDIPF